MPQYSVVIECYAILTESYAMFNRRICTATDKPTCDVAPPSGLPSSTMITSYVNESNFFYVDYVKTEKVTKLKTFTLNSETASSMLLQPAVACVSHLSIFQIFHSFLHHRWNCEGEMNGGATDTHTHAHTHTHTHTDQHP